MNLRDSKRDCIPCARGSFNSATGGVTACEKCAAGTYMSDTGAIHGCTRCPSGKYGTATGAIAACSLVPVYNATRCEPGFTTDFATGDCSRCSSGSYSAFYGASACVTCPSSTTPSQYIASVSAAHCSCRAGYVCKYTPQRLTLVLTTGLNISVSALAYAAGVPTDAVAVR